MQPDHQQAFAVCRNQEHTPAILRVTCLPHLHSEETLLEIGEALERSLGQFDVLRVRGATRARVDDAHEDALLRGVAHWLRRGYGNGRKRSASKDAPDVEMHETYIQGT